LNLYTDFSQRVVVPPESPDWTASPAPGVHRRMLERDGGEIARATSVVRFDPGAVFPGHVHDAGEEFLVLSGTFADEHGTYPTGTYVRNPPGLPHNPHSEQGCTLLVKLRQFQPGDDARVVIDTAAAQWLPGLDPGLKVLPLHEFQGEHIALVRWAPGTRFKRHVHPGGEEIFVLEGVFADEYGEYPAGTWLRNPPYSAHTPFSREGCLIYVKVGHIPPLQQG